MTSPSPIGGHASYVTTSTSVFPAPSSPLNFKFLHPTAYEMSTLDCLVSIPKLVCLKPNPPSGLYFPLAIFHILVNGNSSLLGPDTWHLSLPPLSLTPYIWSISKSMRLLSKYTQDATASHYFASTTRLAQAPSPLTCIPALTSQLVSCCFCLGFSQSANTVASMILALRLKKYHLLLYSKLHIGFSSQLV